MENELSLLQMLPSMIKHIRYRSTLVGKGLTGPNLFFDQAGNQKLT